MVHCTRQTRNIHVSSTYYLYNEYDSRVSGTRGRRVIVSGHILNETLRQIDTTIWLYTYIVKLYYTNIQLSLVATARINSAST